METQKAKITLYAKRSMGEKLSASFGFVKENWKQLLEFSTYLILPLCLVQLLFSIFLDWWELSGNLSLRTLWVYDSFIVFHLFLSMIGNLLLSSLVYAMIRTYQERKERLTNISFRELKPLLFSNMRKLILIIFLETLLLQLIFMAVEFVYIRALSDEFRLVFFTEWFSLLRFGEFLLLLIVSALILSPLALWAPIRTLENISLIAALKKSCLLGFATWRGVFSILIVMGIVSPVLTKLTSAPLHIIETSSFPIRDVVNSIGLHIMVYKLTMVGYFCAHLAWTFIYVGLAYQYGHASEKPANVTVESGIDNLDKP